MILKILLLILLNLSIAVNAFAVNWCNDANIVACWTIEEGSGTSTTDASSNSNDGTFKASGEPVWSSNTPLGINSDWSVDFDGTDDFIDVGKLGSFGTDILTNVSYVVWVKTTSTAQESIFGVNDVNNNQIFVIEVNRQSSDSQLTGAFGFYLAITQSYANVFDCAVDSDTGITDGSWHHIGVVLNPDAATPTADLYYDGTLQTETCRNTVQQDNGSDYVNYNVYLGAQNNLGTTINPTDASLDDNSLFISLLDSTDINDIMDNGLVQAAVSAGTTLYGTTIHGVTIN